MNTILITTNRLTVANLLVLFSFLSCLITPISSQAGAVTDLKAALEEVIADQEAAKKALIGFALVWIKHSTDEELARKRQELESTPVDSLTSILVSPLTYHGGHKLDALVLDYLNSLSLERRIEIAQEALDNPKADLASDGGELRSILNETIAGQEEVENAIVDILVKHYRELPDEKSRLLAELRRSWNDQTVGSIVQETLGPVNSTGDPQLDPLTSTYLNHLSLPRKKQLALLAVGDLEESLALVSIEPQSGSDLPIRTSYKFVLELSNRVDPQTLRSHLRAHITNRAAGPKVGEMFWLPLLVRQLDAEDSYLYEVTVYITRTTAEHTDRLEITLRSGYPLKLVSNDKTAYMPTTKQDYAYNISESR